LGRKRKRTRPTSRKTKDLFRLLGKKFLQHKVIRKKTLHCEHQRKGTYLRGPVKEETRVETEKGRTPDVLTIEERSICGSEEAGRRSWGSYKIQNQESYTFG